MIEKCFVSVYLCHLIRLNAVMLRSLFYIFELMAHVSVDLSDLLPFDSLFLQSSRTSEPPH